MLCHTLPISFRRTVLVAAFHTVAASLFFGSSLAVGEENVALNFVNADIEIVVKAVSLATGRNFLIDPRVKGTVNLFSGQPVPRSQAYGVLAAALRLQGFALVESDNLTKVVPEAEAKTHANPVNGGKTSPGSTLVTQVFHIRNESATQLVPVLKPLISLNNALTAYPNSNTLVITDYADNIDRLSKIIEAIDSSRSEDPELITVRHMSAIDLANMLNRSFSDGGAYGGSGNASIAGDNNQRFSIVADMHSNSLVIRSDSPSKLLRIRKLAASLDQPTSMRGNIHVVYLKNAEAVKVAQTLRAIVSGQDSSAVSTPNASRIGGQFSAPPDPSQPTNSQPSNIGLSNNSSIQADPATNSLIITATEPIYNNLRAVIEQLDKRRAQVQIEAVIVELSATKASEFGVQWQNITGGTGTRILGGTNFGTGGANIIGVMENAAKATATGTLGLAPGLNVGIVRGTANLAALLHVLETDNQANILSTPSILTLDNEEARIVIGQNVPFITGAYAQTGNTVANPFQTYERKDVGLSLKVKPQITEGGVVRVQIYQEASSLQASSLSNGAGPITNKRALESTVLVDDGNIIALGGLIEDNLGTGEDKVPLLGEAPLIGGLFRYETKKRSKTNLMVFLRPTIIRDVSSYRNLANDRYDMLLGKQQQFEQNRRSWYSDSEPAPILPQRPQVPPSKPVVVDPSR